MSAGTLTLTSNSAAVVGSGTSFSTELAAGDFVVVTVGGVPYTLPIKTVNSNTSLTLVSIFTGPTQSGAAWSAVPRVALNMVTAALVTQSAEALRGLNYDKQNWQSIFSGTGTITVKLPDGSTWSGPAWNGISTELAKKANSSDLGTAAAKNAGTASGNLMEVGAFGGPSGNYRFFQISSEVEQSTVSMDSITGMGTYYRLIPSSSANNSPIVSTNYWYAMNIGRSGFAAFTQFALPYASQTDAGRFFFRGYNSNAWSPWKEVTTSPVSDGTMKNIEGELEPEESLQNVVRMEFKRFTFKGDESETPRRGVISQQIQDIDPEYVKNIGGILHLDTTPMLLDALAAIKALLVRDEHMRERVSNLEEILSARNAAN